ncbi:hypothetical protein AAE478_000221 [Parahypoxylon ruwenzoriense]
MPRDNAVVKDTSWPLGQIRHKNRSSIVSSLLRINKHAVIRENGLRSLECLYLTTDGEEPSGKRRRVANGGVASPPSELLRRRYLYPISNTNGGRDYVAVSYTWGASKEEKDAGQETVGRYFIESRRSGEPPLVSKVRDVVWDRVLNYAEHINCENIWIDRECIDQDDAAEKEAAMQRMHHVYGLSRRPIALLTCTIKTIRELDLLANIMCDKVRTEDESATLDLLNDITSNLWWTRAWTFQEDYKASTRMSLLIPHCPTLEGHKRATCDELGRPLLGNIDGEICIKSVDFRRQATLFCISYRRRIGDKDVCDKILKSAAKYNVLLREECSLPDFYSASRSMTPTILADIGARGISEKSDLLAIAANCSSYSTRLKTKALDGDGSSLSLSILALCFLNGEIMENDPELLGPGTLNDNIFEYLSKQALSNFQPPVDRELTFIKSCRFIDPQLTPEGTQTKGHLWKLGKIIADEPLRGVKFRTLEPLVQLATNLQYRRDGSGPYAELATLLCQWIHDPSHGPALVDEREWMASEVENAVMEGKALRLGCLVHPIHGTMNSPYRAIFVYGGDDDWDDDWDESSPSYVFTSSRPLARNTGGGIAKHVSLEVDVKWPGSCSRSALPRLYIKRWLNGLYFFEGLPQRSVLFPWPPALLE